MCITYFYMYMYTYVGFISLPSLLEKIQVLVAANEPELIVLRSER